MKKNCTVGDVTDTYKHQGMRRRMIETLIKEGNFSENILRAMGQIPRHFFFEKAFVEKAYENKAFPIGENQTISQPYTVAYQTELLNIKEAGQKVLEIGTGSGYQACVLSAIGAMVFSIERNRKLFDNAQHLLTQLPWGQNIMLIYGDGCNGVPRQAPFDRILITAGTKEVPTALLGQLRVGGILVAPVGGSNLQVMQRIVKVAENEFTTENFGHFQFVPLLSGMVE